MTLIERLEALSEPDNAIDVEVEEMEARIRKIHRRLFNAMKRGVGCRLSRQEVSDLALTGLGEDEAIADVDDFPSRKEC